MTAAKRTKMTFKEALILANQKKELIGNLTKSGATLDEVLIAPTNPTSFDDFKLAYVNSLNPHEAIVPYIDQDCFVVGVFDKYRIRQENIIIISEI